MNKIDNSKSNYQKSEGLEMAEKLIFGLHLAMIVIFFAKKLIRHFK